MWLLPVRQCYPLWLNTLLLLKIILYILATGCLFTWSMLSLVSKYCCWLLISFLWISSCMWSCCTSSFLFSSSSLNCSSCSSRLQIWVDRKTWQALQRRHHKTVQNMHLTVDWHIHFLWFFVSLLNIYYSRSWHWRFVSKDTKLWFFSFVAWKHI